MRRVVGTAAMLSCVAGLGGCEWAPPPPSAIFLPAGATAAAMVAAQVPAAAMQHGPTCSMANATRDDLLVRYWVARVDVSEPLGFADMRTAEHLEIVVPAGERVAAQLGRRFWPTGMNDAVVWARVDRITSIEEVAPGDVRITTADAPAWVELERPGPYGLVAVDPEEGASVVVLGLEGTTARDLPRSLWIVEHDGEYPVAWGARNGG